ncbi:MAG: peptidase U32 family protein [Christensenellales bacterium]
MNEHIQCELLAPAGDPEKLKAAITFGADAVYLGYKKLNLRAFSGNFTLEEIEQAAAYVHARGKKIYITLNAIPHNDDLYELEECLRGMAEAGADALIVSDPGVISSAKKVIPHMPLHLSTQANCTNYLSASFYHSIGITRIILSRELGLQEIRKIREETPESLELETFVHGAMCMSYSGRCHLSHMMTGRDANRGSCAQPCRWQYALVEEKRPGVYYPIVQDERGSYVLSAQDLCMIEHLHELAQAGVGSFKIEGRMKTMYYVANVVNAYRRALGGGSIDELLAELYKSSHRPYGTGFFFGRPESAWDVGAYLQDYDFVAVVRNYDKSAGRVTVEMRNAFKEGDVLEVLSPNEYFNRHFEVKEMLDDEHNSLQKADLPQQIVSFHSPYALKPMDILRRKKK